MSALNKLFLKTITLNILCLKSLRSQAQSTYRGRGEVEGGVSALTAGASTTTLLVMVDRVKGGERATPTLTRLG